MDETPPPTVLAFSTAQHVAVMADTYGDLFATMSEPLQPLFGNSLVLGTTCAVPPSFILTTTGRGKARVRRRAHNVPG